MPKNPPSKIDSRRPAPISPSSTEIQSSSGSFNINLPTGTSETIGVHTQDLLDLESESQNTQITRAKQYNAFSKLCAPKNLPVPQDLKGKNGKPDLPTLPGVPAKETMEEQANAKAIEPAKLRPKKPKSTRIDTVSPLQEAGKRTVREF